MSRDAGWKDIVCKFGEIKVTLYVSTSEFLSGMISHSCQTVLILFFNCILLIILQLSQFSLFVPLHPAIPITSGNPYTIVHVHGSCLQAIWLLHVLCCTLQPNGYSVTNNLYFLIPSPLYPFPHIAFPSGMHPNALCVHDSVSVLPVWLVCFIL